MFDGWVWGVGAVAQLDTATDDRLGQGAWGLGPTAVAPHLGQTFACALAFTNAYAMVVEVPPKTGPGTVNDAFFRFVVDMGGPGPDRGVGGKYLILPPDFQGTLNAPIGGAEVEVCGLADGLPLKGERA